VLSAFYAKISARVQRPRVVSRIDDAETYAMNFPPAYAPSATLGDIDAATSLLADRSAQD
jgi:hypothetical protein